MPNYNFNYAFNISGNCNAVIQEISQNMVALQGRVEETKGAFSKFGDFVIQFNQISQWVSNLSSTFKETLAPGAALNTKLAELQAIAGPTAEELALVEKYARSTAKEFGVSAAGAVESYKLLLSQLSPELTKNGEALNRMGRNVATLSKMMGNDATAAAEVLTTAMNQYGISLDDPIAASDRMAEMMNTMAAAAREGSAELPAIKEALSQCGMAAKAAGVSFEETNAAIQVLDKAGKKGSEGGVALRNVMSTLAQGRFLPKDVREELAGAGIKVADLTDKSKSLAERLQILKPVMADDALFSKLFGKENSAAAMALVQGIPKVQQWTEAITGTTTAVDQSQIIMETYNEKLARVQAKFDDMKISIFNCCGDAGIWVQVLSSAIVPLSQLIPLITALGKGLQFLKAINLATFGWIAVIGAVIAIVKKLWDECYTFRVVVFTIWEAVKALFSYLWEVLQELWRKVSDFAVNLWNTIKSLPRKIADIFNAVVNKIKSWINAVRDFVSGIVTSVIDKVGMVCQPLVNAFRKVSGLVRGFFGGAIDWVREKFFSLLNWFIDKYNWLADKLNLGKIARLGREAADRSWAADNPVDGDKPDSVGGGGITPDGVIPTGSPISNKLGGIGGDASKETNKVRNINITIDKLIDKFTISTTNLSESKERIKDAVAEALLSAVNDANYAL